MHKIISNHQFCLIGKVADLLDVLEDLSNQYTTVKSLIEHHLES